ncbi:hypothetical protein S245_024306, partial [Arachis hypogaea]
INTRKKIGLIMKEWRVLYNLKDEVGPIILNDIDEYNKWLVGEFGTTTFKDNDNNNVDNDADLVHEGDNTL